MSFHRQLVETDLSTDCFRELAWWLDLLHLEEEGRSGLEERPREAPPAAATQIVPPE